MAYDEALAARIDKELAERAGVSQRKMFGGIAWMFNGHMAVGIVGNDLMLRLGEQGTSDALKLPYTRPMDFTGRVMKNMVYVEPAGFKTAKQLQHWIDQALAFAASLPPK